MRDKVKSRLRMAGASITLAILVGGGAAGIHISNTMAQEAYNTSTQVSLRAASDNMRKWASSDPYDAQPLRDAYDDLVAARDTASKQSLPSGQSRLEDTVQSVSAILNGINHDTAAGKKLAHEQGIWLVASVNPLLVSKPKSGQYLAVLDSVLTAEYLMFLAAMKALQSSYIRKATRTP